MDTPVTLETIGIKTPRQKHLYLIKNEKGLFYSNNRPYWTSDLNQCLTSVRGEQGILRQAKSLLLTRQKYDENPKQCVNKELYYGFEKLYISEVKLCEIKET